MRTFEIKKWICNYPRMYLLADILLNIYTKVRYFVLGTYTSGREDKICMSIFKDIYHMKSDQIKYFDIGANNYMRGNNSYLFYRKNASGVLVEADTILCAKLKKRKNDIIINAAITDAETDQKLKFYVCSLATRSTLDKNRAEKLKAEGLKITKILSVPCKTIAGICEETGIIPDFFSIDIEGMDFAVLQTIDYNAIPIKVIVAESDEIQNEDGQTMDEFMAEKGYAVFRKTDANTIYTRTKELCN